MKYTCISKTSNRIFMLQIERYLLGMLTLLSCIKITYTNSTTKYKVIFYSHALNLCRIQIFMFHVYFFLYAKILPNIYKKATRLELLVWKSLTKRLLTTLSHRLCSQNVVLFIIVYTTWFWMHSVGFYKNQLYIFLYLSNSGNSDFWGHPPMITKASNVM